MALWLPQILQSMGYSNLEVGGVVSLFALIGMAAMIAWGHSSDRRNERVWHVSLPLLVAAAGLLIASLPFAAAVSLIALGCVVVGLFAIDGPFFSLPSAFLAGSAVASGIALINSVGSLGSFLGPVLIGVLRDQTGSYTEGMVALAIGLIFAATAVLALRRTMTVQPVLQADH